MAANLCVRTHVMLNLSTEEVEGTSHVYILVKSVLGERFSNWRAQGCSRKFSWESTQLRLHSWNTHGPVWQIKWVEEIEKEARELMGYQVI